MPTNSSTSPSPLGSAVAEQRIHRQRDARSRPSARPCASRTMRPGGGPASPARSRARAAAACLPPASASSASADGTTPFSASFSIVSLSIRALRIRYQRMSAIASTGAKKTTATTATTIAASAGSSCTNSSKESNSRSVPMPSIVTRARLRGFAARRRIVRRRRRRAAPRASAVALARPSPTSILISAPRPSVMESDFGGGLRRRRRAAPRPAGSSAPARGRPASAARAPPRGPGKRPSRARTGARAGSRRRRGRYGQGGSFGLPEFDPLPPWMRPSGRLDSGFSPRGSVPGACYYSRKGAVAAKFGDACRFVQFSPRCTLWRGHDRSSWRPFDHETA